MRTPSIAQLVVLSSLVDGLVFLIVLWGRTSIHRNENQARPRVTILDLLLASAGVSIAFVAKLIVLASMGLNLFGLIRLIYIDLVVVVPAVASILLVLESWLPRSTSPRRIQLTKGVRRVAFAGLGLSAVGLYSTWIEPFRLRLEQQRVELDESRTGNEPIRIAVLTDLQTRQVTEYEHSAVDRLMATRPDLILMPGDLFQGDPRAFDKERPAFTELLSKLSAPGGVYFVLGDVDQAHPQLGSLLQSTGIRLLENELVDLQIKDRRIKLGGVELEAWSPRAQAVISQLEADPDQDEIRILVAHRPDAVFGLGESSRIDLVVAGHTHGGQIVIPGFGPPMTLSDVPRSVAAGGLHRVRGNRIYVSRGVGCERGQAPRIRFLCPPEITLLELANRHQDQADTQSIGSSNRSDSVLTSHANVNTLP